MDEDLDSVKNMKLTVMDMLQDETDSEKVVDEKSENPDVPIQEDEEVDQGL